MGHHARTLAAVVAVIAATLVTASSAFAHPSVVRVETKTSAAAFVARTAVDAPAAVTIADPDPLHGATPATCAADSPAAALAGTLQVVFSHDAGTNAWRVTSVNGLAEPPIATGKTTPAWVWRLYVDQHPMPADEACTTTVPANSEVLLYQGCSAAQSGCFAGTPLYLRVREGGPYDMTPQIVPGRGAPVVVHTIADLGPTGAIVTTDEGRVSTSLATGPLPGQIGTAFTESGPHSITATKGDGSRPPARMDVCVSEGNDGYCGSTRYQPPPEIPYDPSPCATNGHDGLCGTDDTTGPVTHVTNIKHKQKFKKGRGPGQVTGTIDTDPNGVQDVRMRLTRVSTTRVRIKPKKKSAKKASTRALASKAKKKAKVRYKTVKRCTTWDDRTALLETVKCGTKYGKWFTGELNDLRNGFAYSFAMTLPAGTYTLEVQASDENKFKDLLVAGRSLLTFTVL
jgi:hypothetical protein